MWPEKPHGARGYGDLALWYVCMCLCVMQNHNSMTEFFLLLLLHHWIYYFFFLFEGSTFSPNICTEQPDQRLLRLQKKGQLDVEKKKKSVKMFFSVSASLHGRKSSAPLNKKDDFEFVFKNEHFLRRFRQKSGSSCASGVADVCRSLSRWCVRWFSRACVC